MFSHQSNRTAPPSAVTATGTSYREPDSPQQYSPDSHGSAVNSVKLLSCMFNAQSSNSLHHFHLPTSAQLEIRRVLFKGIMNIVLLMTEKQTWYMQSNAARNVLTCILENQTTIRQTPGSTQERRLLRAGLSCLSTFEGQGTLVCRYR